MIRITLTVPDDRDRAAWIEVAGGSGPPLAGMAAATADPDVARRRGNPGRDPLRPGGHPPFGRYRLAGSGSPPMDARAEYGETLLVFEPVSGPALDAESYGRLTLLVYAGRTGRGRLLRRTQGGVRLAPPFMPSLLERMRDDDAELLVVPEPPPRWWAFWRRRRRTDPLAADPPRFHSPPYDEETLAKAIPRRATSAAATRAADDDDRDRWRSRDDDARESSSREAPLRGGGGTGGGGGATGGWQDAPAAGRGPGVDAAGRIVAAAGVAAVAAAAATAHAARETGGADHGSTATDGGGGGGSGDGGSDATAGPEITSTSTAY